MATWAKGVDFKNAGNTTRIGGVGVYGTDNTTEKIYLGLGTEPWNNTGLQITTSSIDFKGNKVYHAGNKPTASEIGAAASSHTHNYAGSSSAGGAANSALACTGNSATSTKLATARTLTIGNTGKTFDGSANVSWSLSEIGAAASSHTHTTVGAYIGVSNTTGTNGYGLSLYGGATAGAPSYGLMFQQTGTFGTHGAVTSDWATYFTMAGATTRGWIFKAGNAAGGNVASISATGVVTAASFVGPLTGNASTASSAATLTTARTINGTSFNGSANITTANWGTARTLTIGSTGKSVNGSENVTWSLAEIGAAAASHSHSYLPLSGGTLTGGLNANGKISVPTVGSSWITGKTLSSASIAITTKQTTGSYHPILAVQSSSGHVVNIGGLGDSVGFYGFKSDTVDNRTDWSFAFNAGTGTVSSTASITAPSFSGSLSGNATTATTLATARTINGTSFNGSANITTANWGTARTITIGNTGKSVNGSGNVSWSLSEIGAAASSHTHSYLPLSGGTMSGTLNVSSSNIQLSTNSTNGIAGLSGEKILYTNSSGQTVLSTAGVAQYLYFRPNGAHSSTNQMTLDNNGNLTVPTKIISNAGATINGTAGLYVAGNLSANNTRVEGATRISNLNTRLASGWYSFTSGATGAPCTYGVMLTIQWTASGDFGQIVLGSNNALYTRYYINGAYSSWSTK